MKSMSISWLAYICAALLVARLADATAYAEYVNLHSLWSAQAVFWLIFAPVLSTEKRFTTGFIYTGGYMIIGSLFSVAVFSRSQPVEMSEVLLFCPLLMVVYIFGYALGRVAGRFYYLLLSVLYLCPLMVWFMAGQFEKSRYAVAGSGGVWQIINPLQIYSGGSVWLPAIYVAAAIIFLMLPAARQEA